jgi:hypothetical protein
MANNSFQARPSVRLRLSPVGLNSNVRITMTVAPPFFLVAVILGTLIFFALLVVGGLTNVLTNKYRPEFTVKKPFRSALLALTIAALINMIIGLIQAPASAVINHDPLVPPFSLTLFIVSFIVYLNRTPDTITEQQRLRLSFLLSIPPSLAFLCAQVAFKQL